MVLGILWCVGRERVNALAVIQDLRLQRAFQRPLPAIIPRTAVLWTDSDWFAKLLWCQIALAIVKLIRLDREVKVYCCREHWDWHSEDGDYEEDVCGVVCSCDGIEGPDVGESRRGVAAEPF